MLYHVPEFGRCEPRDHGCRRAVPCYSKVRTQVMLFPGEERTLEELRVNLGQGLIEETGFTGTARSVGRNKIIVDLNHTPGARGAETVEYKNNLRAAAQRLRAGDPVVQLMVLSLEPPPAGGSLIRAAHGLYGREGYRGEGLVVEVPIEGRWKRTAHYPARVSGVDLDLAAYRADLAFLDALRPEQSWAEREELLRSHLAPFAKSSWESHGPKGHHCCRYAFGMLRAERRPKLLLFFLPDMTPHAIAVLDFEKGHGKDPEFMLREFARWEVEGYNFYSHFFASLYFSDNRTSYPLRIYNRRREVVFDGYQEFGVGANGNGYDRMVAASGEEYTNGLFHFVLEDAWRPVHPKTGAISCFDHLKGTEVTLMRGDQKLLS